MDKKQKPRAIRFRESTEDQIKKFTTYLGKNESNTIEILLLLGMDFYSLVHQRFAITPILTTTEKENQDK